MGAWHSEVIHTNANTHTHTCRKTHKHTHINMADGKASWGRLALSHTSLFSLKHTAQRHTQNTDTHTHTFTDVEDQKHRMKHGLLQA